MHTLTDQELSRQPLCLLDDAQRGEPALVTRNGEPLLLAVPLGKGIASQEVRLEVAVNLFDREQISIGLAARIAGISVGAMIEECGRRRIPVIRVTAEELEQELAAFGD